MKILVMSCDRYSTDTFELFHHCAEKYWPEHPEIIYCTETVVNPYYRTINSNYPVQQWTKRLEECLNQIQDNIVLVCPDDTFFRKTVNIKTIEKLMSFIDDQLIAINLEPPLDCTPCNEVLSIRRPNGPWLTSMMPQLWNRKKLIELIHGKNMSPREAEHLGQNLPYSFGIIATGYKDIDFGKRPRIYAYGIVEGKWAREMIDFCKKEGISIDFEKLGFFD